MPDYALLADDYTTGSFCLRLRAWVGDKWVRYHTMPCHHDDMSMTYCCRNGFLVFHYQQTRRRICHHKTIHFPIM